MHDGLVGSTEKKCNAKSHQGRMDFGHVEDDRLSSLPDDLIHKILSFIELEQAIETSVLSSRWRVIWKSMPCLSFGSIDSLPEDLSKFVYNVLSRRNDQIQLSSVGLYSEETVISHEFVERFLKYAFSHNVQQLTLVLSPKNEVEFPLSMYRSRSLQGLNLINASYSATLAWDLPALTSLHLYDIIVVSDIDIFSKCPNLKTLSLNRCKLMMGTSICHPRLSNLTLEHTYTSAGPGVESSVKVVAPQLKNLTIKCRYEKHLMISAPGLTSLVITGCHPLQLINSTQGFPWLEKVDLRISPLRSEDAPKMVSLLQQLHSIKLLALNLEILELLSSSMELMLHQPSPFPKLKMVKFLTSDPAMVYLEVGATTDTCQSHIFTMVSRQEIRVMRNIVSAQELVAGSRWLLEHSKPLSSNTNKPDMEQPMESLKRKRHEHVKKQWPHDDESPLEMQSHFEIKQETTAKLVKKLQHVQGLVTELPASKRDVLQTTFSSVCQEADIVKE